MSSSVVTSALAEGSIDLASLQSGALRVAFASGDVNLSAPGDRRRFVHWSRARGIPFELARRGERYDLVVVTQAADLTYWSRYPYGRVVYDMVDRYLALPRGTASDRLRAVAKYLVGAHDRPRASYVDLLRDMCRRADAVTCGSEEQAADIRPYCANVHPIPDFFDPSSGPAKSDYAARRPFKLMWDGLPENVGMLGLLKEPLARVHRTHPLELHVVTRPVGYRWMQRFGRFITGDVLRELVPVPFVLHDWSEAAVAGAARACDIAVIPLPLDDPLRSGKPANKLLIYWSLGLPVIASASAAYQREMTAAGVAMGCRTPLEWEGALERCIRDEDYRREMARLGAEYVSSAHTAARKLLLWDRAVTARERLPVPAHRAGPAPA